MKHLKVLGLAVVAVAAMMAIFGSASASAVQICKTVPAGTGDGKCTTPGDEAEYSGPIVGTSTNPVLTTNIATVTCEHSETTVDPNSSTGEPSITGTVTSLSFTGNCKTGGGTACTVTVVNLPYEGHLYTNKLEVTDEAGAGATVKCGFLINCTFTSKSTSLEVTHVGDDTIFHASKVTLERAGGFCPETSEWNATYTAKGITVV